MENNNSNDNEMKLYNLFHHLESEKNYMQKSLMTKKQQLYSQELAKHIHVNYDKMDKEELKYLAIKCLTEKDFRRILLDYELTHYHDEDEISKNKDMSLKEFIKNGIEILNKYQGKAGGFYMDNYEWKVYDYNSISNIDYNNKFDKHKYQYNIYKNEAVFENTTSIYDSYDEHTIKYIDKLIEKLESLSKNIKIDLEVRKDRKNKTAYILIWAIDDNIMDEINEDNIGNDIIGL